MLAYLQSYRYRELGWCRDKGVRDTGPYIAHVSYGTHPAVQIYYSPEVMAWLRGGRKGVPADGAVIIKEQYGSKPAAAFAGLAERELRPTDWTIMIRRSGASHDGWFWAEVYTGMFDTAAAPTSYPNAGFGLYCLRCHASAAGALTVSSLENIRGFPGEPVAYRVDDSWRHPLPLQTPAHHGIATPAATASPHPLAVQTFPAEPLDTALAPAGHAPYFVTSSQCLSCHSAAPGNPFGPTMWVTPAPGSTAPGINVSEYGEWRWSPMGLAGRDPVFYAQLESELAYVDGAGDPKTRKARKQSIVDTCMTCHGAMGKRSFAHDFPGRPFSPEFVFDTAPAHAGTHYGGLARDGISCAVCHRATVNPPPRGTDPLAHFLEHKINGRFDLGPPDKLFGPFKNDTIATYPMSEALGAKPTFSRFITSSRMCGSCHTIDLPIIDAPAKPNAAPRHGLEQATYLEWLNSSYQTEYAPQAGAKSCQDCHMPAGITNPARGVELAHIASRIALVQDDTYPQSSHSAPRKDITVRYRDEGFRRHELLGLNAFLLETFRQFPNVLGVRTTDYMTGSSNSLNDAVGNVVRQARASTAKLDVRARVEGSTLTADVEVTNLTGHRFPSGVGFRRAFLEVVVRDTAAAPGAAPLFTSGRTDARGRIVGDDGTPLPSESFARGADGKQQYQEHFDEAHPIVRGDQVQIFEELTRDASGNFTTSFLRRDHEVKDNRLLPRGWSAAGPAHPVPAFYLHATYPGGRATSDPRYRDGRGHAIVRYALAVPRGVDPAKVVVEARLYYQAWAPYFLEQRRAVAGPASHRFATLVDRLDLDGGELAGWKLRIAEAVVQPGT
jgi:hypothetical protein